MTKKTPKATHQGMLEIGEKKLDCAVLDDGTRVISRNAIFKAFGRTKRGRAKSETRVPNMPSFIDAKNLQSIINNDLERGLKQIEYVSITGKHTEGYNAEVIPLMCDLYLTARERGVLKKQQLPLAVASEMLLRSFAKIGIIALVDEATGYQVVRDREELQKILSAYISEELLPWTTRFPMEFFEEMFRLRGWPFSPMEYKKKGPRGPRYAGKLVKQLVYKKLPPGITEELENKNPPTEKGHRKYKHHQWLTDDIGNPHLEKQVAVVTTLMKISPNWRSFTRHFERAFKKGPQQQELFPGLEE